MQPKPNQEESLPAEKPRDSIRKSALTEELIELDIPTLIFEGKNEVKKEIIKEKKKEPEEVLDGDILKIVLNAAASVI